MTPETKALMCLDTGNNRVLVFNVATSTIADGENALYVLGQSDFISQAGSSTSPSSLNNPLSLVYDASNTRLFVADNAASRVLVFAVASNTIADGENAEALLGQGGFNTAYPATSQNNLSGPSGLAYDASATRLFVSDNGNNRVLVFNASTSSLAQYVGSITGGEPASHILGQSDYSSSNANTSQAGFSDPLGLAYDTMFGRLFVADQGNDRIMVFNNTASSTFVDNENASNVLGQSDFVSANYPGTTQSTLVPNWIAYDSGNAKLFNADSANRVLEYSFVKITTASLPNGTVNSAYLKTVAATSTQGTLTFSLVGGSLPTGLSLATTTGYIRDAHGSYDDLGNDRSG